MRITLKSKAAFCVAAALAVAPLVVSVQAASVLPSSAATTNLVTVAPKPAEGSTNVKVDGSRIILGDAPATMGSAEVKQRSGIANLDPIRFAPTGAVVGMAGKSAQVTVECQTTGQSVAGSQGTTNVWLRVNAGMYVSKAWISAGTFAAC